MRIDIDRVIILKFYPILDFGNGCIQGLNSCIGKNSVKALSSVSRVIFIIKVVTFIYLKPIGHGLWNMALLRVLSTNAKKLYRIPKTCTLPLQTAFYKRGFNALFH